MANINTNGIKGKTKSLQTLLYAENIDIALISESKLTNKETANIKGYKWIGKNRKNRTGGGVGILISNKIANHTTEDNTTDEETTETKWIKLECKPKNIAIGVFYGPQEKIKLEEAKLIYQSLENQISLLKENNEVIIGGDFNAKLEINTKEAKQKQSRNGKMLQQLIENTDLITVSTSPDIGIWTRANRKKDTEKSIIDYILVTPTMASNKVAMVIDETGELRVKGKNESDHNTMIMTVKINKPRKPTYIEPWKLNNVDGWRRFNEEIRDIQNNKPETLRNYNEFEKTITESLKNTIGKQKIRTDKPHKPKNDETKQAKIIRKTARKDFRDACIRAKKEEIQKTKTRYLETQDNYRRALEELEKKTIEKRLEEIAKKAKIQPNTIWEIRKKAKPKNELEYNTITEDDRTITDPQETKDHIANYFEELYQARPGTPAYDQWTKKITKEIQSIQSKRKMQEREEENQQGEEEITYKELQNVIKKLKRKKSLGPDGIPNEIFLEADENTKKTLLTIINRIHQNEQIPPSWLQGHIIRLYKGKGTKGKCSNERGITLASNIGKVYERIINERVKKVVQITEAQAGGIPGSATVDHLIVMKQTINEIKNKGKTAYLVFLDVQKAYDKAWLDAILYVLHKNGVKGKNLQMVQKLNSNLSAKIHTRHGLTREIRIRDSIRQGGVLSVVEYATLIDEISKELKIHDLGVTTEAGEKINSLLWMDDVCLIHHDPKILQEMLDITNHVALKYHIEFGAAKCKVVKIGKGKKSTIKLNGQILEEVDTYKYLGELISKKNNLEAHIEATETKIHAVTQSIITETGNKEFKGMKMQAIWQLFDATVTPIMTYGSESWNLTRKEENHLQTIHNKAIKTILALPQGTPTNILLAETGQLPIKYTINKKKIMQAHRLENKDDSLAKRITSDKNSLWKKMVKEIMNEYHLEEKHLQMSKEMLKKIIDHVNKEKYKEEIRKEAQTKSKTKHWAENISTPIGNRPQYMEKLTRKQCSAIIRTRSRMLATKTNQKNQHKDDNQLCRYCGQQEETQEHLLIQCPTLQPTNTNTNYLDVFMDHDLERLRAMATHIMATERKMEELT